MKGIAIIFSFITICSCDRTVVEPKIYLAKIFDHVAAQLLAEPGTLKLENFDGIFNTTLMAKSFDGTVKFHSGFVNRIGKFQLNEQKYKELWNDTMVKFKVSIERRIL